MIVGRRHIFYLFLSFIAFLIFIENEYSWLRHLKYTTPFIFAVVASPFIKRRYINPVSYSFFKRYLILYAVILLLNMIVLLVQSEIHVRFFKEAYFIMCPIISIMLVSLFHGGSYRENANKSASFFFYCVTAAYLMFLVIDKGTVLFDFKTNFSLYETNLLYSESNIAFLFGYLTLYFFLEKNYRNFAVSLLLTIVAYKRIVIVGVSLTILLYYLKKVYKNILGKKLIVIIISLNFLFIYLSILIALGELDPYIREITGHSTNYIFVGRQFYHRIVINVFGEFSLFGIGLGKITSLFFERFNLEINPHSDVIKLYLEFGIVLFFVWLYCFYRFAIISYRMFLYTFYTNIIFFTDNTFIYMHVMLLYYLLMFFEYHKIAAEAETGNLVKTIRLDPKKESPDKAISPHVILAER